MRPANITNVKPLLQSYTLDGDLILCIFKCNSTGQKFAAMSHIPTTINEPVFRSNEESAFNNIRHSVSRMFQKIINGRFGSRIYDDEKFFDTKAILHNRVAQPTEDLINDGIVLAFSSIISHFKWSDDTESWVAIQTPQNVKEYGFEKLLREGKPLNDEEKIFLSRVLLMVAGADETLREIEKLFLFDFIFPVPKDLNDFRIPHEITREECDLQKRFEFKKAVILFSWAIALTDRELDRREADFIMDLGIKLKMDEVLIMNLCEVAGKFVLVKYLEHLSAGIKDKEKVKAKAREISSILLLSDEETTDVIGKFFSQYSFFPFINATTEVNEIPIILL